MWMYASSSAYTSVPPVRARAACSRRTTATASTSAAAAGALQVFSGTASLPRGHGRQRQHAPEHRRDHAQLAHEPLELLGVQALRAVGERLLGVVVHLDEQPVRARGHPARAIGITLSRRPVPWLGSTRMGRWLSFLTTGIAEMSSVLRVAFSKVRMPRSHRITCVLPPARMYSAESSHSSIVAERPRLSSTGRRTLPSSLSRSKFCMLRAPTW